MAPENLSYGEISPEEWVRNIGRFRLLNDELIKGPCPRCDHPIERDVSILFGSGLIAKSQRSIRIRMKCNCGRNHPGRPDGVKPEGCGAAGELEVDLHG